ncbi:hypothetical protein BH10ACT7_BH10ACT7_16210 [soil metagenome]
MLVRWLLVAIAVAALAGGVSAAAWVQRYLSSAEQSGVLDSSAAGIATATAFRAALTRAVGWRVFVTLAAGILALMISSMTRADAAPVLMVVMLAWTGPVVYGALLARRIETRLRDEAEVAEQEAAEQEAAEQPTAKRPSKAPSAIGGAVLGLVVLASLAALILALAQVPWTPSERDSHEAYQPYTGESQCTGRPASRLSCIIDMQRSPSPFPTITVPDIRVPDIEIPEDIEP